MTPIQYHRILLKISGEMLAGDLPYGINPDILTTLADEISEIVNMQIEVALVIGGGKYFSRPCRECSRYGTSGCRLHGHARHHAECPRAPKRA